MNGMKWFYQMGSYILVKVSQCWQYSIVYDTLLIVTVVVLLLLTESFDVAVFTVYSVLMNVHNLFTLIHSHLFQLDINSKYTYHVSADSMLNSWIQDW